jgi:hypothetical protein
MLDEVLGTDDGMGLLLGVPTFMGGMASGDLGTRTPLPARAPPGGSRMCACGARDG